MICPTTSTILVSVSYRFWVYSLLPLILPIACIQSISAQTNQPNGQYFQEWLLAGPFDSPVFDEKLPANIPSGLLFHPNVGDEWPPGLSKEFNWEKIHSYSSVINLTNYFKKNKKCYAYAYCVIDAPEEGFYKFYVGQDDKIAIWINEILCLFQDHGQKLVLEKNTFECRLNAGPNTMLLKLGQDLGMWYFAIRAEPVKLPQPQAPPLTIDFYNLPLDVESTHWRYQIGDNPEWAEPDYDDSDWPLSQPGMLPVNHKNSAIDRDVYWLRLKINFHQNLRNHPFMLTTLPGTIEVYQDGTPAPKTQIQIPFSFNFPGYQTLNHWILNPVAENPPSTIAIRFENQNNMRLFFSDLQSYQYDFFAYTQLNTIMLTLFASAGFCLILFHLSIYFFYREEKYNLIYVFYLSSLIFYILINLQYTNHYIYYPDSSPLYLCKFFCIWPNLSLLLALFYRLFNKPWPKYSYFIVGFIGITCYIDWLNHDNTTILWVLLFIILFVETIHVFSSQAGRHHFGIIILWIGIGSLLAGGLISITQMVPQYYYNNFLLDNAYWFGILSFAISISIYGAYRYTLITKKFLELTISLEEKIQARTLELGKTNTQLKNEIAIRKQKETELELLSFQDSLTGIANRRHFDLKFDEEWKRAQREKNWLTMIMCDVDFFKQYNDTYGHQAGDDSLRLVAKTLQSLLKRPGDIVARYGGEEFAILLIGTEPWSAASIAESMRKKVEQLHIDHKESTVHPYVTISLGIAGIIPNIDLESAQLLLAADKALYEAKQKGRNNTIVETME